MRFPTVRATAVALVILLGGGGIALMAQEEPTDPAAEPAAVDVADVPRTDTEIYSDLTLFGVVFDRIRNEYVDAPDEQELIRAAIQGMLTSLDPHSGYLPPDNFTQVQEDNAGEFGGLGIEVTMEEGIIKVVSPIDETPAARAGILSNDYIVEINGTQVYGMTLDAAVEMMRGPIGSNVKLLVVRQGEDQPLEFDLSRAVVAKRAVRWSLEGDIGVIRLSRFSEQAFVGIQDAIEKIYDERDGAAPKGIILDLRNNPGGLVDQAVFVSDAFLKQGAVVLTRGRQEQESARYDARPDALDAQIADVPLVVLINGGSASAAEIVAGALQDHKRATLVGTRSFGKGSVQSISALSGGQDGAMRLTTARYYTPNNRSIQASGISPDIVITQDVPDEFKGRDEILGEAALPGQIGGGSESVATVGSSVFVPTDKELDTQLQYAIRLIHGEETSASYPPKPEV